MPVEFLHDVQNCIEINTTDFISVGEDQIIKIEYQNDAGIISTAEYIVNDVILNTMSPQNPDEPSTENKRVKPLVTITDQVVILPFESTPSASFGLPQTTIEASNTIFGGQAKSNDQTDILIDSNCLELGSDILSPRSEDDSSAETDLTSLNWLHNITNIMPVPNLPTPPISPKPKKKTPTGQEDLTININYYQKNGEKKPPFSYATLICMAMGKNGNKMTLSAIYHWIRENFLYYRKADPNWQVCVIQQKVPLTQWYLIGGPRTHGHFPGGPARHTCQKDIVKKWCTI